MTKGKLHEMLANTTDVTLISQDDLITVYGNDKTRLFQKSAFQDEQPRNRADLPAQVYNLNVTLVDTNYVFTPKTTREVMTR